MKKLENGSFIFKEGSKPYNGLLKTRLQ